MKKSIRLQVFLIISASLISMAANANCPFPTIDSHLPTANICQFATPITISGTFNGAIPYIVKLFNVGDVDPIISITGVTTSNFKIVFVPDFGGTRSFEVVVSNSECPSINSQDGQGNYDITVSNGATPQNISITGQFCENSTGYLLAATNTNSNSVYSLFRSGIFVLSLAGTTGQIKSFGNQTIPGLYDIKGRRNSTGCVSNMLGTLTIKPLPTVPTYTFTACGSNQLSVKGSSVTTAAGIIWSRAIPFGNTELTTITNNAIYTYPSSVSGMQNFNVKASLNGCESAPTANSLPHQL